MTPATLRPTCVVAVFAAVCLAASSRPGAAQSPRATGIAERLEARAPDPSDPASAPNRVEIVIERWSSDAQADALRDAVANGPDALLTALQSMKRRVGFILTPGMQGRGARARGRRSLNILFAREISTPSGREIVAATEFAPRFQPPDPGTPENPAHEFALIDIRFGADGRGVAKVVPASEVGYNKETRTIEAQKFAAQPARLVEVTSAHQ